MRGRKGDTRNDKGSSTQAAKQTINMRKKLQQQQQQQ